MEEGFPRRGRGGRGGSGGGGGGGADAGGGGGQAIGYGWNGGDAGSLAIDGMRVFASEGAEEAVAAAQREATCRGGWAKVEACPHGDASGVCPWCGAVEAWARGYVEWAGANGVAGAWNAKDGDGIANVFRYLFDEATGDFADPPLLSLEFDTEGHLVARTPAVANTNGFTCALSAADEPGWTAPESLALDPDGTTPIPDFVSPTRFFRLLAVPSK